MDKLNFSWSPAYKMTSRSSLIQDDGGNAYVCHVGLIINPLQTTDSSTKARNLPKTSMKNEAFPDHALFNYNPGESPEVTRDHAGRVWD